MSNYTKSTNFAAKDSLTSGDPDKVIKGAEIDTEFNNLQTASATKANRATSANTDEILTATSNGDLQSSNETVASVVAQAAPAGTIHMYGGSSAPTGFLLCDGSAVSRTTYADLFAIVGTDFGNGDGSTTFNVPDMRSRFPLGLGQGGSLTNRVLAATGGEEEHTLIEDELPTHRHFLFSGGTSGEGNDLSGDEGTARSTSVASNNAYRMQGRGSADRIHGTSSDVGADDPHNNMPPFLVVNFIIKT